MKTREQIERAVFLMDAFEQAARGNHLMATDIRRLRGVLHWVIGEASPQAEAFARMLMRAEPVVKAAEDRESDKPFIGEG